MMADGANNAAFNLTDANRIGKSTRTVEGLDRTRTARQERGGTRLNDGWANFGLQQFRITAVAGAWPKWSFTVQLVVGFNSATAWPGCFVTDAVDLAGINARDFTPGSYPALCGEGVMIENSTGKVSTGFAGGTASTCKMRPPIVGDLVEGQIYADQNSGAGGLGTVVVFTFERSAQPD